jgi:hypothetical protein
MDCRSSDVLAADKTSPAQSRSQPLESPGRRNRSQHPPIVAPHVPDGRIERRKQALVRGRQDDELTATPKV